VVEKGSVWLCIDEDYPEYGKKCKVIYLEDDHDWEDDLEVEYEDKTRAYMKLRRFVSRHKKCVQ